MENVSLSLTPLSDSGEVVTFYSYKGGTGRTMALSNLAVLLARQHNSTSPVLMIDWDMEAPGLHHYFELHEERPGVLELFEACRDQLAQRRRPAARDTVADGAADESAAPDDEALAREVLAAVGWQQYVSRVDQSSQLYLMRAGRFDQGYGERLAAMHWDQLFDSCPALFRCFADLMARHFRYVLVDSRTGRTDSAGICTTLLPRKLVVVFTPNRQSLEGVEALVTRAAAYRSSHEDEQRPLLVYPLPSRIEMGDSTQRAQWRRGAPEQHIIGYQPIFERLMRDCYGLPHVSLDSYFDEVQLQQTRTFAYGEQLAVRMDQGGDRFSLTRTFEAFLDWLGPGYFPWQSSREIHLLSSIADTRHALEQGDGEAGIGSRALSQPLARDLNLLGELYLQEGRLRQATACFEESLALRQRAMGDEHLDTVASKGNLAGALRLQGQLDEAQFLEESVIAARERLLGPEHLDTLAARSSLAATLAQQHRTAEALNVQDSVLDAYLRQLGAEHLLTLACQAARAELLFQRGDIEHARQAQEQVLASRKRTLGAEHADTLRSKTALARTLVVARDLDGARRLLDEVARAQAGRLGAEHPETRRTQALLEGVAQQAAALPGTGAPEVHQDATMDDYGDALARPSHLHARAPHRTLAADAAWPPSPVPEGRGYAAHKAG
ncbi:KGGVGR-motif variant AAA ATPase [Duganella sp. Leaf126]|uniref:KGGVGR-motif variant AAA ATPase n=1 Tax=Duganella sp. Leaf126 TaxID=1736266 RepID=UPI000ADC17DE|nr:tetratricopeptide repeat protein [Duganella sp. Leaf126]